MKLLLLLIISIFIINCEDKSSKAKIIDVDKPMQEKTISKPIKVSKETSKIMQKIFQDTAKIQPSGKYMILIFGANTDPYTKKLKEDIANSKAMQDRLTKDFMSYYFKTEDNLRHKIFHENEFMDVDTKTLIDVYAITGTPTIIFTDKNAKSILVVPGYMPIKQFLVTMDFIDERKYKNKDRKNGEVYEALRDFYKTNGIKIKDAK